MKNRKSCIECSEELTWGDFAYDQTTCWLCFRGKVLDIVDKIESSDEKAIILHILDVVAERFRKDRFFRPRMFGL